jgi:hypothetical protein
MRITKTYVDAIRPHLPADVRMAVPCADEGFAGERVGEMGSLNQRMRTWNAGIENADWFQAVTIHTIVNAARLGKPVEQPAKTPEEAAKIFDILMAHWDEGVRRATGRLADRFPGKEVWMTEWNPRQGVPLQGSDTVTQAMVTHAMVRCHLAMLQQPAITLSSFQLMSFTQDSPYRVFAPDGQGGWSPYPVATALGWLCNAVNVGGATYQRWIEAGGSPRPGGGYFDESYLVVEAADFTTAAGRTLIIQNAGAEPRKLALPQGWPAAGLRLAETLSLPDLVEQGRRAAEPKALARGETLELPPYSITRLVWS